MVELVAYNAIERDTAQRFGYFRMEISRTAPWPWYPCTPTNMVQEPDGSAIALVFGRERFLIRGAELGEIPLSLAGGNCLALVVYVPGYHAPPVPGKPVITSIEFYTPPPPKKQPGRPGRPHNGNGRAANEADREETIV